MRRKLQRIAKKRLVFLDQTGIELGASPRYGLSVAGQEAKVAIESKNLYPKRVDIMGAISYDKTLSLEISLPSKRSNEKRKGYRKRDILKFISSQLAKALPKLKIKDMILLIDKGCRVSREEAMQAFQNGNCHCVKDVMILPTQSGKHISPLDNCLWHELKDDVRTQVPTTEEDMVRAIRYSWKKISSDHLHRYYKHCALTRGQDSGKNL